MVPSGGAGESSSELEAASCTILERPLPQLFGPDETFGLGALNDLSALVAPVPQAIGSRWWRSPEQVAVVVDGDYHLGWSSGSEPSSSIGWQPRWAGWRSIWRRLPGLAALEAAWREYRDHGGATARVVASMLGPCI